MPSQVRPSAIEERIHITPGDSAAGSLMHSGTKKSWSFALIRSFPDKKRRFRLTPLDGNFNLQMAFQPTGGLPASCPPAFPSYLLFADRGRRPRSKDTFPC